MQETWNIAWNVGAKFEILCDTSVVRQYPFTCACHENLQQLRQKWRFTIPRRVRQIRFTMKGTSTGQRQYDKRKAQKREMDRQNRAIHGNFSADLKPTPEQIEKKRKRDELNAKIKARLDKKAEKRRRGRPKFDFECRACGFTTSTKSIAQTHIPKCKIIDLNILRLQIALASMFSKNPYYDSLLACGYKERKSKKEEK